MIRSAKEIDIPHILEITDACAIAMRQRNIFQWDGNYPNADVFLADLRRNELWVLESQDLILGSVVISSVMDVEYNSVYWNRTDAKALYVHRLAVHPDFQRRGWAGKLMDFAENQGRNYGYNVIRLDTFSRNPGNQRFYENRGYQRCGVVFFPNQSAYPFYCYELPLI